MNNPLRAYILLALALASYPLQFAVIVFLVSRIDEIQLVQNYNYEGRLVI